ncbi:Uma2 family endonuclease [Gammaproteobacteria bacterium]
MSTQLTPTPLSTPTRPVPMAHTATEIVYPDSDGMPMADNTRQFEIIVMLQGGLALLFVDRPDVFVAGDLLWYPVKGNNRLRVAPDVMVVFGRPPGYRGSYKQWCEDDIAPQVVFEVLSPGNRATEMAQKFDFYQRHGVEEYYIYDPDRCLLEGWLRQAGRLTGIPDMKGWMSPRLGIRFGLEDTDLAVWRPDGRRLETFIEVGKRSERSEQRAEVETRRAREAEQQAKAERQRAEAEAQRAHQAEQQAATERQRAEAEAQRAHQAEQQAEAERRQATAAEQRAQRLAERLRALGLDPEVDE